MGGLTSTQYPDQDTTDTRIRALSYFPYFLTHFSYGLTSCLIFCDCGCTPSRCLHRAVCSDPQVFFPSGYSSFKAQQCVQGARTAPSRAPNLRSAVVTFICPCGSPSFNFTSATFFMGLPPTGDTVLSPAASVPPTHCPPLFSRLLMKVFRHTVTMQILRAVQHQLIPWKKANALLVFCCNPKQAFLPRNTCLNRGSLKITGWFSRSLWDLPLCWGTI